jgi:hypothetical protein
MRIPEYSTQFRRDVKRADKRGKDMGKLKESYPPPPHRPRSVLIRASHRLSAH